MDICTMEPVKDICICSMYIVQCRCPLSMSLSNVHFIVHSPFTLAGECRRMAKSEDIVL